MNPHYALVAERASHRCEYCHAPEAVFNFPFEVEHVVPPLHGGPDIESNWALACRSCDLHKAAFLEATDPQTQANVRLFHPRTDPWGDHFRFDETTGAIVGHTAIGRATIVRLQMNHSAQLLARHQWTRLKLFRH